MGVWVCVCVCVYVYIYMCVCVCVCVLCVCVCVCVRACVTCRWRPPAKCEVVFKARRFLYYSTLGLRVLKKKKKKTSKDDIPLPPLSFLAPSPEDLPSSVDMLSLPRFSGIVSGIVGPLGRLGAGFLGQVRVEG